MATQVIQTGGNVRLIVSGQQGRGIVSTQIVGGFLIITYTDGTTQNAGPIGGGDTPDPVTSVFGLGIWDDSAVWNDADNWKDAA